MIDNCFGNDDDDFGVVIELQQKEMVLQPTWKLAVNELENRKNLNCPSDSTM